MRKGVADLAQEGQTSVAPARLKNVEGQAPPVTKSLWISRSRLDQSRLDQGRVVTPSAVSIDSDLVEVAASDGHSIGLKLGLFCAMKHRLLLTAAILAAAAGPAHASLPLAPLAEAIMARHVDALALAPIPNAPFDVAVAPPDATLEAQSNEHRLEVPGGQPSPRQRPSAQPTQTAEVVPAEVKVPKGADTLASAIAAYQRFRSGVLAIAKLRLDQPDGVRQAQRLLAGLNQVSLSRGWLAMCSQIATKAGEFVAGLTSAAAGSPDALKAKLEEQPGSVMQVNGWQTASSDILKQVANDTGTMETVAFRLVDVSAGKEAERASAAASGNYGTIPAPPPGSADIPDAHKAMSTQISELNARVQQAKGAAAAGNPPPKAKTLMAQILALGGRMQLDKSSPIDPQAASYADNDQCLRWASLNLNQCLAAAHDNTERAWCLGAHGIHDRVKCWSWLVDGS